MTALQSITRAFAYHCTMKWHTQGHCVCCDGNVNDMMMISAHLESPGHLFL